MTRRRFVSHAAERTDEDEWLTRLVRRTNMGYDEDGRSREVDDHPEQVEQSKIASAPHGVRSELPPTDSTDPSAWLRDFVRHGDVDPDGWRRAWGEA